MQEIGVVVSVTLLILAVVAHIVVMSRWSKGVDNQRALALVELKAVTDLWETKFSELHGKYVELKSEHDRMRERQHRVDGAVQRLQGLLISLRMARREDFSTEG